MSRFAFVSMFMVATLCFSRSAATVQWPPESFTNLKVLPQDINTPGADGADGSFTRALGVRCTHCHVGEEGQPLSTYKFAADDKPAKRTARLMIEMVRAINSTHLPALDKRSDPPVQVEMRDVPPRDDRTAHASRRLASRVPGWRARRSEGEIPRAAGAVLRTF